MWILYIIGGFILICILWHIGIIPEFLTMIGICLVACGAGALISWIAADNGSIGAKIGIFAGAGLYLIYCISRIIDPEIEITYYENGSSDTVSSRTSGIIGLIVMVIALIFSFVK